MFFFGTFQLKVPLSVFALLYANAETETSLSKVGGAGSLVAIWIVPCTRN